MTLLGGVGIDVPAKPGFTDGSKVAVSIRPEQLHIVAVGGLSGTVKAVMPLGAHVIYEVELRPGVSLKVSEPREGHVTVRQSRRAGECRADVAGGLSRLSRFLTTKQRRLTP